MNASGLVTAADLATAACALLNAGYFARRWTRSEDARRRIAALALVLVSLAAVVEAGFSLGLYWSARGALAFDPSDALWALWRLPLLVATALVSALVLRRLRA